MAVATKKLRVIVSPSLTSRARPKREVAVNSNEFELRFRLPLVSYECAAWDALEEEGAF